MKIAIISDIHGNIYSLMRVLDDIEDQKVDFTICLGDLVGYGPHPNEVVAMIRRKNIPCLKGNYDASVVDESYTYIRETSINSFSLPWTVKELRAANKYYLENLPTSMTLDFNGKKIKFVHGSTNAINEYLLENGENTAKVMSELKEDILVCAHTHLPSVKEFGGKLFVNDGSVGKPKIGNPNATYCILDIDKNGNVNSSIREVPYEYKRIVKDMQMLNFPSSLIRSFETGVE
ncbi:metallophosphoesterase family protein [Clostridium sp. LP20]|uniref:metallophosphoesterase family protein n=1 Tax=Clostridium sp. LP20 TaxID=3418665 RepID=UPI003EE602F4